SSRGWPSIPAMLAATVDAHGDRPAVVDGDERLTWGELDERAETYAAALVAAGLEAGDRVSIWAPNGLRWIVAALGSFRAGAVLVPINTRFKGGEAADILERSGARALVTTTDFLDTDYMAMLRATSTDLPALGTVVVTSGPTADGTVAWDDFTATATDD